MIGIAGFEGYAVRFDELDTAGRIVLPGALDESLRGFKDAGVMPALLWNHQADEIVGRLLAITVDKTGLMVRGHLHLHTARGRECLTLMRAGELGFSSSFTTTFRKPGVVEQCQLREITLTATPSNPNCRAREVARQLSDVQSFESFLVDCGVGQTDARLLASRGWPAIQDKPQ